MTTIRAKQARGSWIAKLENGWERLGLASDNPWVPVIIEDCSNRIDGRTMIYRSTKDRSGLEDWWNKPAAADWRRLMMAGHPILLRKGMDQASRTAGKKIAFFRVSEFSFNDSELMFKVVERLAECA
ncbi:hypothetical protein [Aureimonas sp. Leaf324]|jgi:hypothetical protein|uniref:hypothetical protein n=1 Tax=Aureimonas sp. Leaf324 TaxID=1736336 RepID=UPI000A72A6C8|nr:hypothetical protein [Aureimonas sp. Leaf324]